MVPSVKEARARGVLNAEPYSPELPNRVSSGPMCREEPVDAIIWVHGVQAPRFSTWASLGIVEADGRVAVRGAPSASRQ